MKNIETTGFMALSTEELRDLNGGGSTSDLNVALMLFIDLSFLGPVNEVLKIIEKLLAM